jgi:hypothetical protein
MAMELVSTTQLSTSASTVTFSSIPQTGKDLLLLVQTQVQTPSTNFFLRINGDTTSGNYVTRKLAGDGSATSSTTGTLPNPAAPLTSNTAWGSTSFYISNYALTAAKTISTDSVTENNATAAIQEILASTYTPTGAITSLVIAGSSMPQHSIFSLYIIS